MNRVIRFALPQLMGSSSINYFWFYRKIPESFRETINKKNGLIKIKYMNSLHCMYLKKKIFKKDYFGFL